MEEPHEGATPETSQELAAEQSAPAQPEAQDSAAASATADAAEASAPAVETSAAAEDEPAAPAVEASEPAAAPVAHQEASGDHTPAKNAAAPAAPEAPVHHHKPADADSAPAADAGHKAAAAAAAQQQPKAAPKPAAAAAPAPAPAPAAHHADEESDIQQQESTYKLTGGHSSYSPHKETAFERLTMPTAMRLLQKFGWTPENASTFHIASGVSYNSKRLAPDEISAMVDRLCTVKPADSNDPGKLHAVKLVYDEAGKETYVPVKEVTKEENIAYMSQLYERCKETRQKTHETLAAKYLQPLGKPRKVA